MVCKKMFGDAVIVTTLFDEALVFPKSCSECPYGATNIELCTGAGQAVYDKVRRAVVEFFEGVTFAFDVKSFLTMLYKWTSETEGFFTLVHPSEGYKDRLQGDGLGGLDFAGCNFALNVP